MKSAYLYLLLLGTVGISVGCTKLNEGLNSTLTNPQTAAALGANGTALLLNAAYADIGAPLTGQDLLFSLEENTSDEALVPTRGGDWDDNGVWRVLHAHTWNADHQYILNVFNTLNKASFDATNVLAFKPTAAQAAEARFLRALVLYYQLDLYGQYPIRDPGEDLRKAPLVRTGADAINFIISELTTILPDLPADNGSSRANPSACRTLLMKCYLQKGAFINRASPTFDAADMNQVVTLGNAIVNSGRYRLVDPLKYFTNFAPDNTNTGTEGIFVYPNTGGVSTNNSGITARWNMTLHYNQYTPSNPNAGWNGFTTISDFYSAFNTSNSATAFGPSDTTFDVRLGGRVKSDSVTTITSGLRPGLLVGQQYNEAGVALKDRNGNNLAFTPAIASDMKETGSNREITGIRVIKYPPDYPNYQGSAGNDLMIFRYADVLLMIAEANARLGNMATALTQVNALRSARGAAPLTSMVLANPANAEDPRTLLAERGRELYWENMRRTDLIRFGMFLKPWQYKTVNDAKNLVFPVPNQALAANPNLKQNTGY
ncbi:MAG: RagB/SusD family nutrient uptake outer membrane protein [Sphingobacteriaceae bacterium]|nr:MAG: RagB/SusD family nutrient uptake outer membrane protein [Sphingobacteriaceae bacterium]